MKWRRNPKAKTGKLVKRGGYRKRESWLSRREINGNFREMIRVITVWNFSFSKVEKTPPDISFYLWGKNLNLCLGFWHIIISSHISKTCTVPSLKSVHRCDLSMMSSVCAMRPTGNQPGLTTGVVATNEFMRMNKNSVGNSFSFIPCDKMPRFDLKFHCNLQTDNH